MALLLDYARDTVGLRMGAVYLGRNHGYTTDEAKVTAMQEAGAIVRGCGNNHTTGATISYQGPRCTFPAWEISFPVGRELP